MTKVRTVDPPKRFSNIFKDQEYSMRPLALLLFNNFIFLFYIILSFLDITFLKGITVGFMVLFLPGLGWTLFILSRKRDIIIDLVVMVLVSSLIFIAGLLFFQFVDLEIIYRNFIWYLLVVSNIGIFLTFRKKLNLLINKHHLVVFVVAIVIFGISSVYMPKTNDADIHFTSTAYGLIHELKPYTNLWGNPYEFQHSTWPHLMSACSIFLMGKLHEVKHQYIQSKNGDRDKYPYEAQRLRGKRELLFSSRIPHFFLAALLLLILFEIVKKETLSSSLAFFTVTIFSLIPEMFIRFAFASYECLELFIFLAISYAYLYHYNSRWLLFLLGFWALWINQKTVILPMAVIGTDFFRNRWRPNLASWMPLFGFCVGLLTICLYGYMLDWGSFYGAFLVTHGLPGLFLYSDIPGFFTAWTKAILFMNPLIFIMSFCGVLYLSLKSIKTRLFIIPMWFFIGTLVFVMCKWPHIKNCSFVYPALIISLAYFLKGMKYRVRQVVAGIIIIISCFNFFFLYVTVQRRGLVVGGNEEKRKPRDAIDLYIHLLKEQP
ncbi:hypothetical protein ACFL0P_03650 [Candidatus Omnitrophota bacterium]